MDAERLGTERVYDGKIIGVDRDRVRLPNGRETSLEVVRHPGAAAVVPLLDDGRVVLVRQYRWAAQGFLLEVPAGKLDAGEGPESCAGRELEEETGYRAGRLERLGEIWTTPGFTDEVIHLFLARELTAGRQDLDQDEVLEEHPLGWDEIERGMIEGTINDAKTLCGLFLARDRLRGERG